VVCTLIGCLNGAVVLLDDPIESLWPKATFGRLCIVELAVCSPKTSPNGTHVRVASERAVDRERLTIRLVVRMGHQTLYDRRRELPVRQSEPNGPGCGECHAVIATLDDRLRLVPAVP
jgi:hypothetical protein